MAVDFSLLDPNAFARGFAQSKGIIDDARQSSAMRALGVNPGDQRAMGDLMSVNPEAGFAFQRRQDDTEDRALRRQSMEAEARTQQLKQAREQISVTGRLLSQVRDEASYQQARQAAQGLGFDLSQVPANYDPQWVAMTTQQAQALAGNIDRELMTVAPGSVVLDKATGAPVFESPYRPQTVTDPSTGQVFAFTPGQGQQAAAPPPPQPGQIEDGYRFVGGNPADPNSWQPVGGAGQSGPQTFQP